MHNVFIATDDMQLASALREQRPQWSLAIATDDRSARALMEASNAEVMLLDRRSHWVNDDMMHEARRATDTVVIALVPDLAVSDAVRNSRIAHQVMSAATPVGAIASTCDRVISVRQIMGDEAVRAVVAGAPDLAAPPELWLQLSQVLEDPNSTASDVAAVVASDPVIAAHVLRLANSAFFGLSRNVTQLRDAVALLGFTTIRAMVLESTAQRAVGIGMPELKRAAIRDHCMATARVARSIAGSAITADAFMAGLLMDIGTIVLASVRPEEMRQAIDLAEAKLIPLFQAEQEIFGFTHAAVSAALLGMWGMPYTVLDAVAHHHDRPDLGGTLSVRETLYLARDATQTYGVYDPYDLRGPLLTGVNDDLAVSLLVDSARSIAAELDQTEV